MNKMNKFSLLVILIIFAVQLETNAQQDIQIIDKPNITMDGNLMTPEALWSFGRLSDPQVSPDGKTVIYGVSYYSIDQNKGNRDLYSIGLNAESSKRLTKTEKSEFNAIWRPDGKKIGFLTSESGSVQLWEMNPDGSGRERVSDIEGGITGFKYSPDQTMVLYTKEVELENKFKNLYEGLPLASGRLMDDLMYRHWDHWVDTYSHVFYCEYEDGKLISHKDIMEGEPWSAPLSPFGGIEQIQWSSDGKIIAYTCKKLVGKDATISTNSEIYFYEINNGITTNMTEGIMGFDVAPSFSPDGKWMAWESMERDGYESDQSRLYLLNLLITICNA